MRLLKQMGGSLVAFLYAVGALYYLILVPPLNLVYEKAPNIDASESSVYVPGAGFAGFWYHLGLFQGLHHELDSHEYYCYSSGCLSLVLAFLNTTVDAAFDTCGDIQMAWMDGTLSRYDMVNHFLDRLVAPHHVASVPPFFDRLRVIVTSTSQGVDATQPSNRDELVDLLVKTTWIPFVTGSRWFLEQDGDRFVDGGFSRVLHPECDHKVVVPTTWATFVHSLNPGLGKDIVYQLWEMGKAAEYPFESFNSDR